MSAEKEELSRIPLTSIRPSPWQGRFLDENNSASLDAAQVKELVDSISKSGLMQPVIVRQIDNGYEMIDGHRRLCAFKAINRAEIPAIVRSCADKDAQVLSIVGNLQRKNLKPLELAVAYRKALSSGLFATQRELSLAIGKHESFVGEILNTLSLDRRILDDLEKHNTISDIRTLRAIRRVGVVDSDGICEEQYTFYRKVVDNKLTREQVIAESKSIISGKSAETVNVSLNGNRISVSFDLVKVPAKERKTMARELEKKIKALVEKMTKQKEMQ